MERSPTSPEALIASLPERTGRDIAQLDALISAAMPGASRTVWQGRFWGGTDQKIIGYGDLKYQRSDRRTVEWFMVGLAAQKNHLSLYVNAVDDGEYLIRVYASRLGRVKVGSAVATFKRASDLDLEVLAELARRAHQLGSPTT